MYRVLLVSLLAVPSAVPSLAAPSLAAVGAAGCTTEVVVDAGEVPPPAPSRELELAPEASLALTFGERAAVSARLLAAGAPVVDETVRFALSGAGQDSSVTRTEVATDAQGRAGTTVIAGGAAAVFRLRASAEGADPAFLDVAVGNEGFGGIEVEAPYDGERTGYARRVLDVYADVRCADELPRQPARTLALDASSQDVVLFRTLAAGLSYTVVGRVEGPSGAALALGCRQGVQVRRDEITPVTLRFEDASLSPEGTYRADLEVRSDVYGPALQAAADATNAVSGRAAASRYLDALETELAARGETSALGMLQAERGAADDSLGVRLDAAGASPRAGVAGFLAALDERLDGLRMSGPLELTATSGGDELAAAWETRDLVLGARVDPDGEPPLFLEPATLSLEPGVQISWDGGDTLTLRELSVSLPLGALVAEAMRGAALEAGSAGGAIREGAGCEALTRWIAESPPLSAACDTACAEASCDAALSEVFEQARLAVAGAATDRDLLKLEGELSLTDADADLRVDLFEGPVEGTWGGPMPTAADAIEGTLRAERVARMQ